MRTRATSLPAVLLSAVVTLTLSAGCDAGAEARMEASAAQAGAARAAAQERSASMPSARAAELRNQGLALLENEKPGEAEAVYRELVQVAPRDPLSHANLAISLLRQQKTDEALAAVDRALELAPKRADLLSIKGEVLAWAGRIDDAITVLRQAVEQTPRDPEIVYQLHRTAVQGSGQAAEAAMADAIARLAELRPENVVVLLEQGRRAIQAGDRATASRAFLRLDELVWQTPGDTARKLMDEVLAALEGGDLAAARVPAQRLENVLKVTPMYQQSLREVWTGITGIPVMRFVGEPPPADFGNPVRVTFQGSALSDVPTAGAALAVVDLDGDQRPDVARLVSSPRGALEVRLAAQDWKPGKSVPVDLAKLGSGDGTPRLLAADLDNDGNRDLLAYGPRGAVFLRGAGDGTFTDATAELGLAKAGATAAAVVDLDIEGDLDLALAGGSAGGSKRPGEIYRNNLAGALEAVGSRMLPEGNAGAARALLASDLDRDGDLDLLRVSPDGLLWLDNLRQGKLADRTKDGGLSSAPGGRAAVSADLDNDGFPDLVVADGNALAFLHNREGRFRTWDATAGLPSGPAWSSVVAFDADNDGRLDLAVAGDPGGADAPSVAVAGQRGDARFAPIRVAGAPPSATALAAADLDGDGDLDLVAAGPAGLHRLENRGGDANNWLAVRLKGLNTGSGKNNVFGVGSTLEILDGLAYQFREGHGDATHFGLGKRESADVLRVVWPNGVPQDRIDVAADQLVVEEQVLKGSCPFLYTWDGEKVAFVTDLLWGAPIGLPVAEGVWAGADPSELVRVDGAKPDAGVYRLYVTEELWEAAFFDHVKLWVVDHPADVEVASALRIVPGRSTPEEVRASRVIRPVVAATDGQGRDVTDRLRHRDDVYADGFVRSRYQGLAEEPWTLTFDLGPEAARATAAGQPVRLHLDGWIFPTDASLNLAVDQRADVAPQNPRLEVETEEGWRELLPASEMGFPAGKTKTLVLDLPPLPAGATKLRMVTNLWLGWDRIAWTASPDDGAARVVAKLDPSHTELRFRGFSALVRQAPNAPHDYDYARTTTRSPWLPFAGRYTRYGDVAELLATPDDRSVILGPGDEMELLFDARDLPAPPAGWTRTVFLESHGWDKDADRNTWEPQHLEPLPFRAMTGYPYGPDESFPDTPLHREYRETWLTREVEPGAPSALALEAAAGTGAETGEADTASGER